MKIKDIHAILGVPPATLYDWNKLGHKKQNLAKLLKILSLEELEGLLNKPEKPSKPMMLLSTINCSIGDKSKHFTLTTLKKLFYKKDKLNAYEKYAIKTIKDEALEAEINDFVHYYNIPGSKVEKVLSI